MGLKTAVSRYFERDTSWDETRDTADLAPNPVGQAEKTSLFSKELVVPHPVRKSALEWDAETADLIAWFKTTAPPVERFELGPGVAIIHPARYWASLKSDVARGPNRARGLTGALQDDLRRLHRLFGPAQDEPALKGLGNICDAVLQPTRNRDGTDPYDKD